MLEQPSLRQHHATLELKGTRSARPVQFTPRQNHLLAALPQDEYARLLPHLELVHLPVGWTVYGAGDQQKYLYFPITGIFSKCYVTKDGAASQCAIKGSEGVIGLSLFLGGESSPFQTLVLSAGYAYRLGANILKIELEHDGVLPQLLLHYTQAMITQTSQIAVCNRHHSVAQQLCRWILSCLDRLPVSELAMTQVQIADSLGVRRESVTEAAGILQRAGLIQYSRGHIIVLDRAKLEAQVCECYAVVKREYDRLLPVYRQLFASVSAGSGAH